jgi:hypothetical protein
MSLTVFLNYSSPSRQSSGKMVVLLVRSSITVTNAGQKKLKGRGIYFGLGFQTMVGWLHGLLGLW